MIFDTSNVHPGTTVVDVESGETVNRVVAIDTDGGEVLCHHDPARVDKWRRSVEEFVVRFRSIHPIYGGHKRPVMFHCYGRQE